MIVEGSYPYIVGGVAHWVQHIISSLSDLDFVLWLILPQEYKKRKYRYKIPPNVLQIEEIFLNQTTPYDNQKYSHASSSVRKQAWKDLETFSNYMKFKNYKMFDAVAEHLLPDSRGEKDLDFMDLLRGRGAFEMFRRQYHDEGAAVSFMDYFWFWRSTQTTLYRLFDAPIPEADLYHTVSTGYAGYMGTLAKLKYKKPFLLTEHGIYANEREDEIMAAKSIREGLKPLWVRFFHNLCNITYEYVDTMVTLFEGNKLLAVKGHADPGKIEIVPNGIDTERFTKIKKEPADVVRVGIVARVVPIKDVLTFIEAAAIALKEVPDLKFYVIGPTDENKEYFVKCVRRVKELGLQRALIFTGKVNMMEWYGKIDIMVLTSEREAQPLTILEAWCVEIPCVSTAVGSCPDLLEGIGFITRVKAPGETAAAIVKLARDEDLRKELGRKSRERAINHFDIRMVLDKYQTLYTNMHEEGLQRGRNRLRVAEAVRG